MKRDYLKLSDLIKKLQEDEEWQGRYVCYCFYNTPKCKRVLVSKLTQSELNEQYYGREWWIEDNDLCLMRGK